MLISLKGVSDPSYIPTKDLEQATQLCLIRLILGLSPSPYIRLLASPKAEHIILGNSERDRLSGHGAIYV